MTPLHHIGNAIREAMLAVPLPAVRILFILVPLVLLIWVLFLPASQARPPGKRKNVKDNLKIWAALALVIQIVLYSMF